MSKQVTILLALGKLNFSSLVWFFWGVGGLFFFFFPIEDHCNQDVCCLMSQPLHFLGLTIGVFFSLFKVTTLQSTFINFIRMFNQFNQHQRASGNYTPKEGYLINQQTHCSKAGKIYSLKTALKYPPAQMKKFTKKQLLLYFEKHY